MGAEEESNPPPPPPQAAPVARPQPITPAQFLSWKQRKDGGLGQTDDDLLALLRDVGLLLKTDAEEAARNAEAAQKREADIASGAVQMNGRELFKHEPWVFDNNIY